MPLEEEDTSNLLLIVTGSTLRAEGCDRPLAYRLQRLIRKRTAPEAFLRPEVISDIWYLNSEALQELPTISIGGPGVNAVSQFFFAKLPTALGIDGLLRIQMDVALEDHRCCIWGMDHSKTIDALRVLRQRRVPGPVPGRHRGGVDGQRDPLLDGSVHGRHGCRLRGHHVSVGQLLRGKRNQTRLRGRDSQAILMRD